MKTAKVIIKSKNENLYKDLYKEYLEYDSNIKMTKHGVYELYSEGSTFSLCAYTVEILDTLKENGSLNKIEDIELYSDGVLQENILYEYNKL